jgi:hypothetical protein
MKEVCVWIGADAPLQHLDGVRRPAIVSEESRDELRGSGAHSSVKRSGKHTALVDNHADPMIL